MRGSMPSSSSVHVDLTGAQIIDPPSPNQEREIYLPKHVELISHIAIDIGGSLAKIVYFSRSSDTPLSKAQSDSLSKLMANSNLPNSSDDSLHSPKPNGVLIPKAIDKTPSTPNTTSPNMSRNPTVASAFRKDSKRKNSISSIPGGRLNFVKFETDQITDCLDFVLRLIEASANSNAVSLKQMKRSVKIMATGGGAHMFYDRMSSELGVEVMKEEEMDCLITGLNFLAEIPDEVFWYSDELVDALSHPESRTTLAPEPPSGATPISLASESEAPDPWPRPSPNPPQYSVIFDPQPAPQFPCILVNIGSGVSIIKVDDYGSFERISGTSLGGGTLWGLLSLLTGAKSFDEMLSLSEKGDNSTVDMLVGDIYGSDYKFGLKSSTIASSFGKVFRRNKERKDVKMEDIAKSLLYAISNNIGQIAYMNAEKHGLNRIYFGGSFIRGHGATIATLSYAIRFWSKGKMKALFLRHEAFIGAIGAWLKPINAEERHAGDEETRDDVSPLQTKS